MNLRHNDNRYAALLSKQRSKRTRRAALAMRSARVAFTLCLLAPLVSCVAYLRPTGEWNEPVDLDLDASSLSGVRLKVDCVLDDGEGQATPQEDDTCMKLRVTLGYMGARMLLDEIPPEAKLTASPAVPASTTKASSMALERAARDRAGKRGRYPQVIGDAKTEKPDFRVEYRALPASSNHCGWSAVLFLFTLGIGPCIEDIDSRATLVVTDARKGVQIKKDLEVRVRRVLGLPALALLAIDFGRPVSRRDLRRLAGSHLLEYTQNVVYSFARRATFEAARPLAAAVPGQPEAAP